MKFIASLLGAVVITVASGGLGAIIASPMGVLGGIMGVMIIPWALVLATMAWSFTSVLWAVGKKFAGLPDWATARAIGVYATVTPFLSAGAALYVAREVHAPMWLCLTETAVFGALALPVGLAIALAGRQGMEVLTSGVAEAA